MDLNEISRLPVTFPRDEVSSPQRRDGQSVEVHSAGKIRPFGGNLVTSSFLFSVDEKSHLLAERLAPPQNDPICILGIGPGGLSDNN